MNPSASLPERRQFGRIHIAEPRICHVHLPQSEELWTDQGILVNISLGGLYFLCNKQPPLEKDDIRYLSLDSPNSDSEKHHLGFHVSVVRVEERQVKPNPFAVALRIISDPICHPPEGTNQRDFTSSDKAQLLYQYYQLNKKAYEIIINTPDIRPDKIKNIKYFIDRGSYKIKPDKITQSVINDMLLENILRDRS